VVVGYICRIFLSNVLECWSKLVCSPENADRKSHTKRKNIKIPRTWNVVQETHGITIECLLLVAEHGQLLMLCNVNVKFTVTLHEKKSVHQ